MGEKEDKDEEKQKKTEGGGGSPNTVVLKMNLHCEGCALKIKRSVKRFDGVEAVSVDIAGNKLTVVGKVDPVLLRERVEKKTRKKVEFVDSAAKPKDSGGDTKKPAASGGSAEEEMKQPAKEKKAKELQAQALTTVLKIRLHCEGCINRIRKTIYKIKDAEGGGEGKKEGGGEKKDVDGSIENNVKKERDKTSPTVMMNKMEYYGSYGYPVEITPLSHEYQVEMSSTSYGYENGSAQEPYQYRVNMAQAPLEYGVGLTHAPQMFSDENPNACFIM